MNVRPSGARRSLVVRPAARDRGLVHVRLRDDSIIPDVDELRHWVDNLAAEHDPPATIRTAALFPRAAERFEAAGFDVVDRLVLLRVELDESVARTVKPDPDRPGDGGTRTMRRHHFGAASAVDTAAFGAAWGHDADELADICRATPAHAARYRVAVPRRLRVLDRGELIAFAIAGASSEHGYLQRLSVDPGAQRCGHGFALTVDALQWMMRRRVPDCLVNTSIDNVAALELYESIGFAPMEEQLTVLHFDVRSLR